MKVLKVKLATRQPDQPCDPVAFQPGSTATNYRAALLITPTWTQAFLTGPPPPIKTFSLVLKLDPLENGEIRKIDRRKKRQELINSCKALYRLILPDF